MNWTCSPTPTSFFSCTAADNRAAIDDAQAADNYSPIAFVRRGQGAPSALDRHVALLTGAKHRFGEVEGTDVGRKI
jgi:hypothetical protein